MEGISAAAANSSENFPEYAGFIAAAISCTFLGSNLLPVKQFEVGDGMVFQWMACSGVFFIGLIVQCVRNFPKFYGLPMIGGAMWATGNCCIVAIIKTIGLSVGVLIWATFNMIVGWACGRFGWFGLNPEIPLHPTLNYIGVAFAATSVPLYFFVMSRNSSVPPVGDVDTSSETIITHTHEDIDIAPVLSSGRTMENGTSQPGFWDKFSPLQKKVIGCSLSIFSGTIYGFYFVPVTYLIDHPELYPGVSPNGLDHVFSLCCGIFLASTSYFLIYCLLKRNRPIGIVPAALMPAFISGAMWSIANAGWMLANTTISEAISFPIITTVPSLISTCWGIFYYREIKGWRNFALVGLAFAITITGAVLCGLSKPGSV